MLFSIIDNIQRKHFGGNFRVGLEPVPDYGQKRKMFTLLHDYFPLFH